MKILSDPLFVHYELVFLFSDLNHTPNPRLHGVYSYSSTFVGTTFQK